MLKRIACFCLIFLLMLTYKFENVYASDRVVLKSIISDLWYENIYLIADKITWMEYRNFTVQIGDSGQLVYNFPNWYHGKYEAGLYIEDINEDKLEDIIIILNNDAGGSVTQKNIHILNQIHDPYRGYGEAPVEPIELTVTKHTDIKQHGNIVSIMADKKKYNVNISKYNFLNPRDPYPAIELIEHSITNGKLMGSVGVYVQRDDTVTGGLIGHLNIEYFWDREMYKAKTIVFREYSS